MHLFFLQLVLSERAMQALGWTLLHSLWQGLLLALFAGLVILLSRKSTPALRYNLLAVLFCLFLLVSGFTFIRQWKLAGKNNFYPSMTLQVQDGTGNAAIAGPQTVDSATWQYYLARITAYFNTHAPLVVTIWFIIFSARTVQLLANLGYIQRIRHYKASAPPEYWAKRIQELAIRLGIRKQVMLLESGIAKVPMMAGFMKPVILFPFSLLCQLPPEQVEAILLHELAHIRRRDYVVNLLQSFAEIIFFFNPGLLWVSSMIRDERENCCDDIAIRNSKNKKQLVHALMAFQENNLHAAAYAMAFPGKKYPLLNRIKRIISNDNKTLTIMEKTFLASGLIIAGLMTMVFAQTPNRPPQKKKAGSSKNEIARPVSEEKVAVAHILAVPESDISAPAPVASVLSVPVKDTDTVPAIDTANLRGIFEKTVDGKHYEIIIRKNKITELYIDDRRIPDEKIGDHQPVIDKIIKGIREDAAAAYEEAEKSRIDADMAREQAEELREKVEQNKMQLEQMKISAEKLAEDQALKMRIQAEKLAAEQAGLQDLQGDQYRLEAGKIAAEKAEMQRMQEDMSRRGELSRQMQMAEMAKLKAEQSRIMAEQSKIMAEEGKRKADAGKEKSERMLGNFIDDLLKEGIIKNDKKLSFSLSNREFIVNGVKQPEAVLRKFTEKYSIGAGDHFNYSKTSHSTHTDISIQHKEED